MRDKNIDEVTHILNVMAKSFVENGYEDDFVRDCFLGLNSRKKGYKVKFIFSISWFSSDVMVKVSLRKREKVVELIGCTTKEIVNLLEKNLDSKFKRIILTSKYDSDMIIEVVNGSDSFRI